MKTQPTDKLLPCPFCGGNAYGDEECGAHCIDCCCAAFRCDATTEEWNTRPADKPQDATEELAHELYDRFVMGGWEAPDAFYLIRDHDRALLERAASVIEKDVEIFNNGYAAKQIRNIIKDG